MISVLAMAYLGGWGILLAVLSPVASSFLGMGDAPFYLYPSVNLVQICLAMAAFRFLRIPPTVAGLSARVRYIVFAVAIPSMVGATMAWLLRSLYPDVHDAPLPNYVFSWTAENVLPALIPGIWLHRIVGESYRPFAWEVGRRPKSWVRKTIEHCAPWLLSLSTVGAMLVLVVVRMVRLNAPEIPGLAAPGIWQRVSENVVARIPGFPLSILALTVSFLGSLGYSIQYAKQSWVLSEAVRRHFPSKRISELLLSGIAMPTEQHVVTAAVFSVVNYTKLASNLSPAQLIKWLDHLFAFITEPCSRLGASVDAFVGDSLTVVFGLQDRASPLQGIKAVLEVFGRLQAYNKTLIVENLPPILLCAGVDCGPVIAGEIGSAERRQYSLVGDAIISSRFLANEARLLPETLCSVLFSRRCLRDAGLLPLLEESGPFVDLTITGTREEAPESVYSVGQSELPTCQHRIDQLPNPESPSPP
jgi:adenylate cyclase